MHTEHKKALSEGYTVFTAEMTCISIQQADSIMEGKLRLSTMVHSAPEQALKIQWLLGKRIPKDTGVICLKYGPGFFTKGYNIEQNFRSDSPSKNRIIPFAISNSIG